MQQLFIALPGSKDSMDRFVQLNSGTISPQEFFSPDSIRKMLEPASNASFFPPSPNPTFGGHMRKKLFASVFVGLLLVVSGMVVARDPQKTLIITMTNDSETNALIIVDAKTKDKLQTIPTGGKGGVGGNARGIKASVMTLYSLR